MTTDTSSDGDLLYAEVTDAILAELDKTQATAYASP